MADIQPYIITIGRQLGSGGKQAGVLLSGRLGIPCYDKELIQMASKESGLCPDVFEQADERHRFSMFGGEIFSSRSSYFGNGRQNLLGGETLFKIQSDIIRNLAEKSSCIFVGRCADYILREHPRLLRIFISAEMTDRIRRLTDDLGISEKEARTRIEQTDRKRADYYNFFSNKTWGAAKSYDLCMNSSVFTLDEIADVVCSFATRRFGALTPRPQ